MFWELKGKGNLLKFLSGLILFCNRVPVRPVVNSRAPIEDDLETEAAVLANFDFLQNDVEDEEDNEDDNDDDGGSADDESDDRDDLRLGRRMGKRAKQGVVLLPFLVRCKPLGSEQNLLFCFMVLSVISYHRNSH